MEPSCFKHERFSSLD